MSTKDRIVDKVIELLQQNVKYEEISMTMVADKVGIGKSTIYDYFNTKSELLIASVYKYMILLEEKLLDFDLNDYNFHDAFIKQLNNFLNNNITPEFALAFITDQKTLFTDDLNKVDIYLQNIQNKITNRFKEIFIKGIEEKIITINETENITYLLNSMILGAVVVQYRIKQEDENINIFESLYNAIVKIFN